MFGPLKGYYQAKTLVTKHDRDA